MHTCCFPSAQDLFTSGKISDDIARLTKEHFHLEKRFTLRDWRQMAVGVKHKVCKILEDLLENPNTVESSQAQHSFSVDQRVYAVSGNLLGGTIEDMLPTHFEACERWHAAMGLVPGNF